MAIDYKTIKKCIKKNLSNIQYPDPDEFEDFDDYQDAYDDEKTFYMQHIATVLGYSNYTDMFKDLGDSVDLDEAEDELFGFFYDSMVREDYYDAEPYDDYDDYDDDEYNDDY